MVRCGQISADPLHLDQGDADGPRTANIAGNLTFHGVTRPVVLKATFLASGVNPLSKGYDRL
jgi:polyisoprenoid-binding protein YceI